MAGTISRRQLLRSLAGGAVSAAAITAMPELLRLKGWYDPAVAQEPDIVLDTFNGLAAMLWPGDDAYSTAQGEAADGPGAIAAGAGFHIREALDWFVPAPAQPVDTGETAPLSGGIASAINVVATTVGPGNPQPFPSHFARLDITDKIETWRRLEEETQALDSSDLPDPLQHSAGVLQFVFGVLPGFVQFFAMVEIDVWDAQLRRPSERPVGWEHTGYADGFGTTPPEGWDDFQGYYGGRRSVES